MAAARQAAALLQELKCCICLSVYSEPITLPCGHTFCKQCIKDTIKTNRQLLCPECRHSYDPDIELKRNTKMCSIIEHINHANSNSPPSQGWCAYCYETAEKLCLDCEMPICRVHLEQHKDSAGHVFTDLCTTLESRKCPVHQELLKYYCTNDGVNICVSCGLMGDHKQHKVEKLSDLSNKERRFVKILENPLMEKKAKIEEKLVLLKRHKGNVVSKTERIRHLVAEVIKDMKKELDLVEAEISRQITTEKDEVLDQVLEVIKILEAQLLETSNQIKEIQNLYNTTDPITLLEGKTSNTDKTNALINLDNNLYVRNLDDGILPAILHSSIYRFTRKLPLLLKKHGIHAEDATSRLLTVGQITQNLPPFLTLILDGQNVDCPGFAYSTSSFSSGQHYWEVDTSDRPFWAVGVSYHNEKNGILEYDADSWFLEMTDDRQYKAVNTNHKVSVETNNPVKVLGVFLEYEKGTVSFYQVNNNCVRLLCSIHERFTRPLYIVMYVKQNGWVRVRKL